MKRLVNTRSNICLNCWKLHLPLCWQQNNGNRPNNADVDDSEREEDLIPSSSSLNGSDRLLHCSTVFSGRW
jgi:hypothetical protein